jgi:putative ABC transport system ATP-binding protein
MKTVKTENLSKTYRTGETEVRALISTNIEIGRGEAVAIVGSSGSGKSTLLHLLGGIDRPTDGKVFIEDEDIYAHDDETLALLRRRRIGFVFQMYNLMPQLTVYENVVLPLGLDGRIVDRPRVEALLESLGLADKHKNLPNQLSGGQQQRVAIARALVTQPAILLADEPTGNLDSKTGAEVLNLLRSSASKLGQTMTIITHDEKVAQFCDRVLRIEDGRVREG